MSNWWPFLISLSLVCQAISMVLMWGRLADVLDRLNECEVSVDSESLAAPAGSTILITPAAPLTLAQFERLKEYLAGAASGNKFVVLDASLKAQISSEAPE